MKEVMTTTELALFENEQVPSLERSNFLFSFSLLPKEERNAINSIYAFCSYLDNIVDSIPSFSPSIIEKKLKRLSLWESVIEDIYSNKIPSPILTPFYLIINRFHIPKQYFLTLIDGVKKDLYKTRYEDFEELKDYCYSVASVVGLISIEIFGYKYEATKNYAINLGYALQLTNILRDIKQDKDRGYIYIPKEDLEAFNLTEEDIINEVYDDRFIEMMRFQVGRVREFFHKARTSLHPDERITIVSAEVMDGIYFRLLEKIELNDFNIYKKRIKVSTIHKFMIALKNWLSVKMFVKRFKKKR